MGNTKRILQVISCLELGGTEAYIVNNYRQIDREKYQFDFLVYVPSDCVYKQEIENMGGRVFFGELPSVKNIFRYCRIFKKIAKENGPYQAMHCHVNQGNIFPLICACVCGIKNRISHSHASDYSSANFLKRCVFSLKRAGIKMFATTYLSCSVQAGENLYGKSFFKKNGTVISNGIDLLKFTHNDEKKASDLKREFNISKNEIVFGNISRFDLNKNQSFTVDVFHHCLKKYPDAVLLLGGVDGGQLNEVKSKVKALGIENSVRFIGKRSDVADCLKLIDVYLFPSHSEGLGIAHLEAQAAGCLCFASTGVPMESDMGLGSAYYYSLDEGSKVWSDKICRELDDRKSVSNEEIIKVFRKKGYDIADSAERLVEIYEK